MANIQNFEEKPKKVSLKTPKDTQKRQKKPSNSETPPKDSTAFWWAFKDFLDKNWTFRLDVVRNRLMWRRGNEAYKQVRPGNLFGQVQSGFGRLAKNYIFDAVADERIAKRYNPLKHWLKGLKCDNDIDYVEELCSYIVLKDNSAEERKRLYLSLKKWFVGAVKTLFDPFYIHKQCVVWQGAQGLGKTPFVSSLLPKEYRSFKNSIRNMNLESKDAKIALTTSLLITCDEFDDFFKSEKNRREYKAYVSTDEVNVRLPFGKMEVYRSRIASFMGSCNESTFLNDATGTQRFTIFFIEKFINEEHGTDRIIENFAMKNVWAYAYMLYKQGFNPQYTSAERKANEQANEAYKYSSDEYETVIEWLSPADKVASEDDDLVCFMTPTQMRAYLNSKIKLNENETPPMRCAPLCKALIRLQYQRVSKRVNGMPVYGYYVRKLKEEAPKWGPVIHPHKMVELN